MPGLCRWIHEMLLQLPVVRYPFDDKLLPHSGIYFFYEEGETWGHGGNDPRIVRVGTHRNRNFRQRIRSHFLCGDGVTKMDVMKPKPSDRSIFRKNIGRALLNGRQDPYLDVWELDFTSRQMKEDFRHRRNIGKEREIESEISAILRERFSFRFLAVKEQKERLGTDGLESRIIGTLAACPACTPSENWLGRKSPKEEIAESGLWLVQHLSSPQIDAFGSNLFRDAVERTLSLYGERMAEK